MKPIGTSLAEIIKASGRSPHEQAGQTTVLIKRRNKRQKCLAMQEPSTEDHSLQSASTVESGLTIVKAFGLAGICWLQSVTKENLRRCQKPVERIDPPMPPQQDVILHKTGSTNGFAGYLVLLPGADLGIVVLANRNYPNRVRIRATYELIQNLSLGGE